MICEKQTIILAITTVPSINSPEEVIWEALLAAAEAEDDGLIMASDDEGSAEPVFLRSGRLGCSGLGLLPVDKLDTKDSAESIVTALANLMVGKANGKTSVRRALAFVRSMLSTADRNSAPFLFFQVGVHPPTTLS
jgi:hypothetical protein